MNTQKILLLLIVLLFLFTRFYKISDIPVSVYWDEASIGINANSIAQSGKDEWDNFLPIHFRAFGEFKLPVYIYSTAFFVKIFGLNEFAIRISSVIFSLGTIIIIYFLALKIFQDKAVALFASFLLTISPWFFIFSRAGYEVSGGLMFYSLGILLMLSYKRSYFFIVAAMISFIISMYSYNSFRILNPITFFLLSIVAIEKGKLKKLSLYLTACFVIFVISLLPIIKLLILDAGFGRVQAFSIFPTIRRVYDISGNPKFQLIYNRSEKVNPQNQLLTFMGSFAGYFSPEFLLGGDKNSRHQIPGAGQVYLIDLFFLIAGIFYLIKSRKKLYIIFLVLFLISPLPASLFKEPAHSLRALPEVFFLMLIISFGIIQLKQKIKILPFILIPIYLIFFASYFWKFDSFFAVASSKDWQYSYKTIITEYALRFNYYENIVISDQYAQPYVFPLFYLKYDPEKFRKEVKRNEIDQWGFSTVSSFGNFHFMKISQEKIPNGKSLIFATNNDKLEGIVNVGQIDNLDGSLGFYVYEYEK